MYGENIVSIFLFSRKEIFVWRTISADLNTFINNSIVARISTLMQVERERCAWIFNSLKYISFQDTRPMKTIFYGEIHFKGKRAFETVERFLHLAGNFVRGEIY